MTETTSNAITDRTPGPAPDSSATPASTFQRRGLLRLSWPLLVVTVLSLVAALGNVILLSAASPELNAAVATANQTLGVLYDITVIFSIGALVVIAQHLGAGDEIAARRATVIVLRASTILGLAMAVFIAVAGPWIVTLINTPPEIAGDAVAYLWIVALGLTFNAYIVAAAAVLRAYGRTVSLLVLGIVINLLDVTTLAVFLLVLELGVVGAALPTLIVRGVGVLLLVLIIRRRTGACMLARLPERAPHATSAWTMARLSIPTVVENAALNAAIVFVVSLINLLGTDAINARSYVLTLTALVTGVVLALAQGNETIVGWDVGEGTRDDAKRRTVRAALGTAIAAGVLSLLLWLAAEPAVSLFGAEPAVVAAAQEGLLISALLLPLSAITTVIYGALRSSGDVITPMVYSIASSVLVLIPVSVLFIQVLGLGIAGVFWALVIAEATRAALMVGRWLRGRWIGIPSIAAAKAVSSPVLV